MATEPSARLLAGLRYTPGMNMSATAMLASPTRQWRIELALHYDGASR